MGLLLSVTNCILLLSLIFSGLLSKSVYFGYKGKEATVLVFIIYLGTIFISFLLCFSIQITYKIRKLRNGFLFWTLCVFNLLELFILLYFLFSEKITNMFLFVIFVLIISALKAVSIRIYHFLYPIDKKENTIQYWSDLCKCLFISMIITCLMLFLTIRIILQ